MRILLVLTAAHAMSKLFTLPARNGRMFGILAVFSKLNEFQSVAAPRPPCDSDDVWAGFAQEGIKGEGFPGAVVPSDVPEGELWKDKASLIRGVGVPGKLTANCA